MKNNKLKLNPFWVTGFVDGEGCFCVSFNLRSRSPLGVEVRPSFSVSQTRDKLNVNLECLKGLVTFFECGAIRFSKNDNTWKYECRDLNDLRLRIVPHFINFPLQTKKSNDFKLFVPILSTIASKEHLNSIGLSSIVNNAYNMNQSRRKFSKEELLSIILKKST